MGRWRVVAGQQIGEAYERHAAPENIEAFLNDARRRERKAHADRVWLEALLSIRRHQVERGEWPSRAHDDDWWASQPKPGPVADFVPDSNEGSGT